MPAENDNTHTTSTLGKAGLRVAVYGARKDNHMKRIDRRGFGAMLTTVSPAALLLAGVFAASSAAAVDHVVAEGDAPGNVVLADGDSLTNSGTIESAGSPAVDQSGPGALTFILNTETGKIVAAE